MKVDAKLVTSIIILMICNVVLYEHIFFKHEAVSQAIHAFPNRILDWQAEDVIYNEKVLRVLDPDKIIYKKYYKDNGYPPITLFVAYYRNLEKADLSHSPVVCFTGQGWKISTVAQHKIQLISPESSYITVNKMYLQKLNSAMIAYYWYQSPNGVFANRGIQKLYMFCCKFLGRSDQNAFVRVTVPVVNPEAEAEMSKYLSSFVKVLEPELRRFLQ